MDNTVYYSQRTVSRFVSIIVVSLSSILPLVSIVLLSKIHKFSTRLWIIAACTVAFSLCLGLVASPKKVEIFSAAAASVCPKIEPSIMLIQTGLLQSKWYLLAAMDLRARALEPSRGQQNITIQYSQIMVASEHIRQIYFFGPLKAAKFGHLTGYRN